MEQLKGIVIVSKDIGEYNKFYPIVDALAKDPTQNLNIGIVAEGLSLAKWQASEHAALLVCTDVKADSFDPKTLIRLDLDVEKVLSDLKPDLVITGLASPINLGEKFGLAANKAGIKLMFVEDLWGVHKRSTAIPDFICTVDSFGERKIFETYRQREKDPTRSLPRVYVTGSPAMDKLEHLKPNPMIGEMFAGIPKILVCGQDESTGPMMEGLVEALEGLNRQYVLFYSFHPKWMKDPSKVAFSWKWKNSLASVNNGLATPVPSMFKSAEEIMPSVDVVVSIYSTTLCSAAVLGKIAVSWNSEIGKERMKESLAGETVFPLVQLGGAIEVEIPHDFFARVPFDPQDSFYKECAAKAKASLPSDFKNTERVVAAILKELE